MPKDQAQLREMAEQITDAAKVLHKALHASMSADDITLGMYREASAHVSHVTYGLACTRSALSEFMVNDAIEESAR
tara:strand:- start:1910 stop:2137 length:228 start_codon:yes stop_codon:yes gene_type:complete